MTVVLISSTVLGISWMPILNTAVEFGDCHQIFTGQGVPCVEVDKLPWTNGMSIAHKDSPFM